tara:strand:- start:137 stop:1243 length:1107 start_codon:yes stop_codon:yes gene_type:complete
MKKIILLLLIINFSCAQEDSTINDPQNKIYELELIHPTKNIPWSLEFIDEKTIIYTEKRGNIFIVSDSDIVEVMGIPSIYERGQGGLMDIELHPDFKENNLIFISYASGDREIGGNTAIASAELVDGKLINLKVLYKGEENTTRGQHFGSRIQLDNDGFLYFTIGDRGNRDVNPQDLKKDGGKVYRINIDGSIPDDNPFINDVDTKKAIYSYGHRNPQGIFLHPQTGKIWTNEHGPRGGDEINIVSAGKNYGWPKITYGINYVGTTITKNKSLPGLEQPLYYWVPSIAPSSFEFVWSENYDNWKGSLLVGSLKYMYLERLELNDGKVSYREKIAKNVGRVRDVKLSPKGLIYIAVENKGIFRLNPKSE